MLKIVISLFTVNPLLAQPQADCMRLCAVGVSLYVCVCVCMGVKLHLTDEHTVNLFQVRILESIFIFIFIFIIPCGHKTSQRV